MQPQTYGRKVGRQVPSSGRATGGTPPAKEPEKRQASHAGRTTGGTPQARSLNKRQAPTTGVPRGARRERT